MPVHIAILDDEPRMKDILEMLLRRAGYRTSGFTRPEDLLGALDTDPCDLLLTDLKMPGMDGLEVLRRVHSAAPDTPVILLTAHATVQTALAALKEGAFDYIEKPFDNEAFLATVARALEVHRLSRENRYLRSELRSRSVMREVVTVSLAMVEVFALARRAANSRATVLVTGESGTGKELVARHIHYQSDRVGAPFVAINCGAFAPGLLEAELFGHEKGAFTGAVQSRMGIFERAEGGTLFLDEIGETDLECQPRLLRVLQEREVLPVGGDRPRKVDVRIVAATNRDLAAAVEGGAFRRDLYFRLAVIPIHLPPLRERPEDILPLARFFLSRWNQETGRTVSGWSPEVEDWLLRHSWPGNVRELENALERAVVLARCDCIEVEDLLVTPRQDRRGAPGGGGGHSLAETLDGAARQAIQAALAAAGGRKQEAARALGIDRTTLFRWMRRLDLASDEGADRL